jgi:apolipoprotein N-acyltransferase
MLLMEGDIYANAALVISPAGQVLGTYHKQHPIQFFSDGVPGRKSPIIPTPLGTLGVGICYDFDYAMTAVRMVHGGAELLVVPTFDATTWGNTQHAQHGRIAQARAAEAGRWVVRVTSSGETMLIGPDGHPTATIPNNAESAIAAVAAPRTGLTPYMRWAFALPYFCLALALLWAIGQVRTGFCAWRARRKTTP